MKRVFLLNPNSSKAITASLAGCLAPLARQTRHTISCSELADAPLGIESDADVALAARLAEQRILDEACEAAVIACFSDPGLAATRARAPFPVFGIAEAAYCSALMLGQRFGVISLGPASIARHAKQIAALGLSARLAGDRSIAMSVAEGNQPEALETIVAVGQALRDLDSAEVLILGCAGMGGHRLALQERLGLPVIDPVQAAVAVALNALDLDYKRAATPEAAPAHTPQAKQEAS